MNIRAKHIHLPHIVSHPTKIHAFKKFGMVLVLFGGYFWFVSLRYGVQEGLLVSALTWSFFVLCTPIADAGFLLDFPLRLLLHVRMFALECVVWTMAIVLNIAAYMFWPEVYTRTPLLQLFEHILREPVPFWSIILLSGIGTFFSIQFGDELLDTVQHSERTVHARHKRTHRFLIIGCIIAMTLVVYHFLLNTLGVEIGL